VHFLLLNQTFHPDVMASGQYLTEVALALVEQGHDITVVASRRAYDHPDTLFPKRETWRGIRIIRVGSTGFGKTAKWRRAADFASFLAVCAWRLALLPRGDIVIALTSPPLISFLGAWSARLRRSRFIYWVMDLNPDEAVAAGWLSPGSPAARLLECMSRFSFRHASRIIALDRFTRDRIVAKGISCGKVVVLPLWSHDSDVRFDPAGRQRFRKTHGLDGKFVVMYSGNHSPCHPLDTLLEAARRFVDAPGIVFCFLGGGSEWRRIQKLQPSTPNLLCLPYQPLAELSASLSAADLHVVVIGDPFVGIVHPCKIYNILRIGAPVLSLGPAVSHLSEIAEVARADVPWFSAGHGHVDQVIKHILRARALAQPPPELHRADRRPAESLAAGRFAAPRLRALFSKEAVLPKLITELDSV
jgi:glycosyltransferase involved in cell wall biosynthesis